MWKAAVLMTASGFWEESMEVKATGLVMSSSARPEKGRMVWLPPAGVGRRRARSKPSCPEVPMMAIFIFAPRFVSREILFVAKSFFYHEVTKSRRVFGGSGRLVAGEIFDFFTLGSFGGSTRNCGGGYTAPLDFSHGVLDGW